MNINFTSHANDVLDAMESAKLRALEEIGLQAEGYAQLKAPKKTGRLQNSISHAVTASEDSVYIGTNVEYAAYQEFGTSKIPPHPYLRPAATEHSDEYKRIVMSEMKSS